MEFSSHLNQAHLLNRASEKQLRRGKFEEASLSQEKVVESLSEALGDCKDQKIRQSIQLQINHHQKQKRLIQLKKRKCEKITKDLRNLQIKMAAVGLKDGDNLQDSIYRTFEETESLLQHLRTGGGGVEEEEVQESDPSTGAKMPKDDKVIIEELQTANNHLRGMVEAMFGELETYKRENADLRSRVVQLETELAGARGDGGDGLADMQRTTPTIVATPVVLVPSTPSHTTTILVGLQDSGHLPPLAPLELPQFDYKLSENDKDL